MNFFHNGQIVVVSISLQAWKPSQRAVSDCIKQGISKLDADGSVEPLRKKVRHLQASPQSLREILAFSWSYRLLSHCSSDGSGSGSFCVCVKTTS